MKCDIRQSMIQLTDTRAAEDIEGFLSTMAVLISLSIAWTVVAYATLADAAR